jgi:hypothetical protein
VIAVVYDDVGLNVWGFVGAVHAKPPHPAMAQDRDILWLDTLERIHPNHTCGREVIQPCRHTGALEDPYLKQGYRAVLQVL